MGYFSIYVACYRWLANSSLHRHIFFDLQKPANRREKNSLSLSLILRNLENTTVFNILSDEAVVAQRPQLYKG